MKSPLDILPDDLVADILLRLPVKHLFRCKLVSKQWKSLILSRPIFEQTTLQLRSSTSFHAWASLSPTKPLSSYPKKFHIGPPSYVYHRDLDDDNTSILASSNGLILSSSLGKRRYRWFIRQNLEFRVTNPLNDQSVNLPPLIGHRSPRCVLGFATRRSDDNDAPFVYKVVLIESRDPIISVDGNYVDSTIEIFSSDTGSWTAKRRLSCPELLFKCKRRTAFTYNNGILHWFDDTTRTIITYDPYCRGPNGFCLIPFPKSGADKVIVGPGMVHLGDEQVLKFGEFEGGWETGMRMNVWCLADYEKGEWCFEQTFVIISRKGESEPRIRLLAMDLWNIPKNTLGCLFKVSPDQGKDMVLLGPIMDSFVPIVPSRWSSPFYAKHGLYSVR